eukprot:g742.t1
MSLFDVTYDAEVSNLSSTHSSGGDCDSGSSDVPSSEDSSTGACGDGIPEVLRSGDLKLWVLQAEKALGGAVRAVRRAPVAMVLYLALKAASEEARGHRARNAYYSAVRSLHDQLADCASMLEQAKLSEWTGTRGRPHKCVRIIADYCVRDAAIPRASVEKAASDASSLEAFYKLLEQAKADGLGDTGLNRAASPAARTRKRPASALDCTLPWPRIGEETGTKYPEKRVCTQWSGRSPVMSEKTLCLPHSGQPKMPDHIQLAKDWVVLAWALGAKVQETNDNPFRNTPPELGATVQLQRTGATADSFCIQCEVTSVEVSASSRRHDRPSNYFGAVGAAVDQANTIPIDARTLVVGGKLLWAGRVRESPHHAAVCCAKLEAVVDGAPGLAQQQVVAFVQKHRTTTPPAAAKPLQHWHALLLGFGYSESDVDAALEPLSETELIHPAQIGPIIRHMSQNSN